jgi:hypothetical protein
MQYFLKLFPKHVLKVSESLFWKRFKLWENPFELVSESLTSLRIPFAETNFKHSKKTVLNRNLKEIPKEFQRILTKSFWNVYESFSELLDVLVQTDNENYSETFLNWSKYSMSDKIFQKLFRIHFWSFWEIRPRRLTSTNSLEKILRCASQTRVRPMSTGCNTSPCSTFLKTPVIN